LELSILLFYILDLSLLPVGALIPDGHPSLLHSKWLIFSVNIRMQHTDNEHFQCDVMFVGVPQEWIFMTHLREGRGRRELQTLVRDSVLCVEENNKGTSKVGTAGMESMKRNMSGLKKY